MPLTTVPLPFGCRDIKIAPISDAGVVGAYVALPNSRTLSFEEAEDFEELRGNDKVVTRRGSGASVEWELEGGGISLDAWKIMAGGVIVDSGVAPNQKRVYTKKATDARPFFKVEGQAISDSGGDFHTILYRCRVTDSLEGSMGDAEFWLTGASGTAFPVPGTDVLYDFVQNETAVAIT